MERANCHIHLPPNFSAFHSVQDAVDSAAQEGVSILGASNYYDHRLYEGFGKLCESAGIEPLYGIEIVCWNEDAASRGDLVNDPGNPGKTYLCGKALRRLNDPPSAAQHQLEVIQSGDRERMETMAVRLGETAREAGMIDPPTGGTIALQVAAQAEAPVDAVTLQERHLAQAFQELFFRQVAPEQRRDVAEKWFGKPTKASPDDAVAFQGEIRTHLMKAGKPAYAPEAFISLADAMLLIRDLDGLIAYPIVADGMNPRSAFEASPEVLIENLRQLGISAVEFIPNRNSPEVLTEYVDSLSAAGFRLTAGTEHNTPERIPVTPMCTQGRPIPASCEAVFIQGARHLVTWQRGGSLR